MTEPDDLPPPQSCTSTTTNATHQRVLVYGATTSIGRAIVNALSLLGHQVVAADDGYVSDQTSENVTALRLALSDEAKLRDAVNAADVVVCSLYTSRTVSSLLPTRQYSNAIRSLRTAGARRIIVTSSAALDHTGVLQSLLRRVDVHTYIDLARMETVLFESGDKIEFTVVRLPPLLTNDQSRAFNVEDGADRTRNKGDLRIGVQDAALFVAREVEQRKWVRRFPVPAYV